MAKKSEQGKGASREEQIQNLKRMLNELEQVEKADTSNKELPIVRFMKFFFGGGKKKPAGEAAPKQSANAKEESPAPQAKAAPVPEEPPKAYDTVNQYGTTIWSSVGSPPEAKERSSSGSKPVTLTLQSYQRGAAVAQEISIYGDPRPNEKNQLKTVLERLAGERSCPIQGFRSLHLIGDLGKAHGASGRPAAPILGFTCDGEGALLVSRQALSDEAKLASLLGAVVTDEKNFRVAVERASKAKWDIADAIQRRLAESRDFKPPTAATPAGSFRGRPVIGRSAPIAGGVFPCQPAREALFVDPASPSLEAIYGRFLSALPDSSLEGLARVEAVLQTVAKVVRPHFPNNTDAQLKAILGELRIAPDDEVPLDFFLDRKTGLAEHHTIVAAYLLERLAKEGPVKLAGGFQIDRSWSPQGTHCWIRYIFTTSDIYILDARQGYVGRLDDHSADRWLYLREEDFQERPVRPIF